MSDSTNPATAVFEMQRTALKQTHDAFTQSADVQRSVVNSLLESVETQESALDQGTELARSSAHAYLDAIETAVPEDADGNLEEAREAVDDGFEELTDLQKETWNTMTETLEEGHETYETAAEAYLDAVDDGFDAALEAHEQAEAQLTDMTDVAADAVEIDVEAQ